MITINLKMFPEPQVKTSNDKNYLEKCMTASFDSTDKNV